MRHEFWTADDKIFLNLNFLGMRALALLYHQMWRFPETLDARKRNFLRKVMAGHQRRKPGLHYEVASTAASAEGEKVERSRLNRSHDEVIYRNKSINTE